MSSAFSKDSVFYFVYGVSEPRSPLEWANIELLVYGKESWREEMSLLYQQVRNDRSDGTLWFHGKKVW